MIAAKTLDEMIAASRLGEAITAAVATVDGLMTGVHVEAHPGKLDIYDIVKREVVAAPGVAIGWSRIRAAREVDGDYQTPIEFTAYIVAEDYANLTEKRRIPRETVAHGIGNYLLDILHDHEAAYWGLAGITAPYETPPPEMRPVFTAKAYEQGACFYAVTWTQGLIGVGASHFAGATPAVDEDGQRLVFPDDESIPEWIEAVVGDTDEEAP